MSQHVMLLQAQRLLHGCQLLHKHVYCDIILWRAPIFAC